jgi:two-component system, OmpR family, sensor histidine kinase KdpD
MGSMSGPTQRPVASDAGGVHPNRGRLHLFLAAAPGAGKTYALLAEGRRLAADGRDVVIGIAETHGRPGTDALAVGLEFVPLRTVAYHGAMFQDLDVLAVLARHPQVVLVDELAQAAIPGGLHEARWHDVEELLEAGIDVVSCLNVQHLESLSEAARTATGTAATATVPDAVAAASDRMDLIDLWPGELRERIGRLYPPAISERALAGYYQTGNLLALGSMARRWMTEHGFDGPVAQRQETPQL